MTYALIYFAIGLPLSVVLIRWLRKQDEREFKQFFEEIDEVPLGEMFTTIAFSFIWPFFVIATLKGISIKITRRPK